jgi:hypothetical protein
MRYKEEDEIQRREGDTKKRRRYKEEKEIERREGDRKKRRR